LSLIEIVFLLAGVKFQDNITGFYDIAGSGELDNLQSTANRRRNQDGGIRGAELAVDIDLQINIPLGDPNCGNAALRTLNFGQRVINAEARQDDQQMPTPIRNCVRALMAWPPDP